MLGGGIALKQPISENEDDAVDDPALIDPRNRMRQRKIGFNQRISTADRQIGSLMAMPLRDAAESADHLLHKTFNVF